MMVMTNSSYRKLCVNDVIMLFFPAYGVVAGSIEHYLGILAVIGVPIEVPVMLSIVAIVNKIVRIGMKTIDLKSVDMKIQVKYT